MCVWTKLYIKYVYRKSRKNSIDDLFSILLFSDLDWTEFFMIVGKNFVDDRARFLKFEKNQGSVIKKEIPDDFSQRVNMSYIIKLKT